MNREAIYQALFDLAAAAPGIVTAGRKLRHWSDVSPIEQPVMFMAQGGQNAATTTGQPTKWTLGASLYIYVNTSGAVAPASVLNPILDYLDTALSPLYPADRRQTLGGLVQWARIEGDIETSEGVLGDQEVAIVPIRILVP